MQPRRDSEVVLVRVVHLACVVVELPVAQVAVQKLLVGLQLFLVSLRCLRDAELAESILERAGLRVVVEVRVGRLEVLSQKI